MFLQVSTPKFPTSTTGSSVSLVKQATNFFQQLLITLATFFVCTSSSSSVFKAPIHCPRALQARTCYRNILVWIHVWTVEKRCRKDSTKGLFYLTFLLLIFHKVHVKYANQKDWKNKREKKGSVALSAIGTDNPCWLPAPSMGTAFAINVTSRHGYEPGLFTLNGSVH